MDGVGRNLEPLIRQTLADQVVDWHGIHGLSHWGRVYDNGMRLAAETGANVKVVGLFAFMHDAQRFHDGDDVGHGHRGAEYAKSLRGRYFDLSDAEFELLYVACRDHTDGETQADVTIQTCWDSDRLDLRRVGITPISEFLCTDAAKSEKTLAWANPRATNEVISDVIADIWNERWGMV